MNFRHKHQAKLPWKIVGMAISSHSVKLILQSFVSMYVSEILLIQAQSRHLAQKAIQNAKSWRIYDTQTRHIEAPGSYYLLG